MMTFLHLKVHNGWGIFSLGSVFQIFHWFSLSCHIRFSFDIYVWLQLKHLCVDIYAWWPFCVLYVKVPRKICQNRLTHLCVAMVNNLGDFDEPPTRGATVLGSQLQYLLQVIVLLKLYYSSLQNNTKMPTWPNLCNYWKPWIIRALVILKDPLIFQF